MRRADTTRSVRLAHEPLAARRVAALFALILVATCALARSAGEKPDTIDVVGSRISSHDLLDTAAFSLLRHPVAFALLVAPDLIFRDGFGDCNASQTPTQSCYSGTGGTAGVGTCSLGTQYCTDGFFGPCIGQVTPSAESCNARDDNCDGAIDNGLGTITCGVGACRQTASACTGGTPGTCTPGTPSAEICGDGIDNNCNGAIDEGCSCVYVSPTGIDTNPGSSTLPKRTISAAISIAGTGGRPNLVCVGGNAGCASTSATTNYAESVTMRNGVHVYGGYSPVGTTWPRAAGCVTAILAQDPRGVFFDVAVTAPTIMDGFTIVGRNDPTNAAVTVKGSTGAVISNDVVFGGAGTTSYGVNVTDSSGAPATPTISNNAITGGNGTALAVGVRSLNSAPVLQGNCSSFDAAGRCTAVCGTVGRFIRGRAIGSGAESYGVRLETSPGTVIDQNSICSGGTTTADAAGVRLSGDATGAVIRANNILGSGAQQNAVGIWADPCAGASPWVVNNTLIAGNSASVGARADGVRALGSCHVRIDNNVRIVGGQEGTAADATGVFCARDAGSGVASRCTILNNAQILGSGAGFPPTATGIRCDDGACAVIQNNGLISGSGGQSAVGVVLGKTDSFVDTNVIQGGCATSEGIGLLSNDSYARIQNNQISGATSVGVCTPSAPASEAVKTVLGAGSNEIDLNSNDLFAEGFAGACISRGIAFDISGSPPLGPRGIVRNNILLAGKCSTSYDIDEMNAQADPRVLENNDLWQNAAVTALYRNENGTNLTTISSVNALSDITAASNISADPLYLSGHLSASSSCRNTGTATGAPTYDFEGDSRPQELLFDIGRDEYKP